MLVFVVPVATMMALDLFFYMRGLITNAIYNWLIKFGSENNLPPLLAVPLFQMWRDRFSVSTLLCISSKSETLDYLRALVGIAAFVMFTMRPNLGKVVRPKGAGSTSLYTRAKNKPRNMPRETPDPNQRDRTYDETAPSQSLPSSNCDCKENILAHSNVYSLYGKVRDQQKLDSSILSKGLSFISLSKSTTAPSFWDTFRVLWSNVLRHGLSMLHGLSALRSLKQHGARIQMCLNPHLVSRTSIFNSRILARLPSHLTPNGSLSQLIVHRMWAYFSLNHTLWAMFMRSLLSRWRERLLLLLSISRILFLPKWRLPLRNIISTPDAAMTLPNVVAGLRV